MSRNMTGAALAEGLRKAAEAAIAGAVAQRAEDLAGIVDASPSGPSIAEGGTVGEGADAAGGGGPSTFAQGTVTPAKAGAHEHRPGDVGLGSRSASAFMDPGLRRDDASAAAGAPTTTRASVGRRSILTLSAPNLFAREFGALGTPADPVIAPAVARLKRRRR